LADSRGTARERIGAFDLLHGSLAATGRGHGAHTAEYVRAERISLSWHVATHMVGEFTILAYPI
jgi:hypothetical protein